jgi:hypothetical protein
MSGEQWTIDAISHALPHPELRARFQREVTFTDVHELPAILQRWVAFIERFGAERPRVEQLRNQVQQTGHLPPGYEAGLVDVRLDDLRRAAGQRRGARSAPNWLRPS